MAEIPRRNVFVFSSSNGTEVAGQFDCCSFSTLHIYQPCQASFSMRVGAAKVEEREGLKKATEDDELPRRLRPDAATSLTSQILARRGQTPGRKEGDYSLAYLSKRMWLTNPEGRKSYIMGFMAAAGKDLVTNR
jgi:hypothetical protein